MDAEDFDASLQLLMDSSQPTCRSLDRVLADVEEKDPEHFQYYVIDGFIVSDNITVNNLETVNLEFVNSDHNPVVLDITLE